MLPQTTFGCQDWSRRTGFGQDHFSHFIHGEEILHAKVWNVTLYCIPPKNWLDFQLNLSNIFLQSVVMCNCVHIHVLCLLHARSLYVLDIHTTTVSTLILTEIVIPFSFRNFAQRGYPFAFKTEQKASNAGSSLVRRILTNSSNRLKSSGLSATHEYSASVSI